MQFWQPCQDFLFKLNMHSLFFRGPPVLDMYVDDIENSSMSLNRSEVKYKSRSPESTRPVTEWTEIDPTSQFQFSKEEANVILGPGSKSRRRSFVKKSSSEKLPKSGPQPRVVEVTTYDPYFRWPYILTLKDKIGFERRDSIFLCF